MSRAHLQVIGLTGPRFTGKSTVATHLCKHYGFTSLHFATPLKTMLKAVFGIEYDSLSATEKEAGIPLLGGCSPRRVLQTFGTEYLRGTLHDEILVQMAKAEIKRRGSKGKFVFDDLRFNHEATFVVGMGGALWKLNRKLVGVKPDDHASEKGICPSFVNTVLELDGKPAEGRRFATLIKQALKAANML